MSLSIIRPARLLASGHFLLATAPLLWTVNWIVGRALRDLPPFSMATARWVFGVALMLPFCWGHVRRDWPLLRRHWRWVVSVSLLGGGIGNVLSYMGLKHTTAINGMFLNSAIPVMIIALTWALLGERIGRHQGLGVIVSTGGVLCIATRGSIEALILLRLNPGDLLLLGSFLLWSFYTIALRGRPRGLHPWTLLFAIGIQALAVVTPFAVLEHVNGQRFPLTPTNLLAFAFVGLCSSILSYVMYNRGVELSGARVAGLYTHLMPVYGVVLASLFLGERLALFHLAGIALIFAGIWIATRGSSPRARPLGADAPTETPG